MNILINYLDTAHPDSLKKLNTKYPEDSAHLKNDEKLGEDNAKHKIESINRDTLIAILRTTTEHLISDSEKLILIFKDQIKRIQRIKMIGGVLAASVGLFTALFVFLEKHHGWSTEGGVLGGAIISTLGGLMTLSADQLERSPIGNKVSAVEELSSLIEARCNIERLNKKILRDPVFPLTDEEIMNSTETLDNLALRTLRLNFTIQHE